MFRIFVLWNRSEGTKRNKLYNKMGLELQKFNNILQECEKLGIKPYPALFNSILGADSSRII